MRQIGNYTADETPLGEGGMGRVLRGWTPQGQQVAIKEILPEFVADAEFRYRIRKEVEFMSRLNGTPGIVQVYDSFELNNHLYIVMEFIDGKTIEQLVASDGAIGVQQAAKYMSQILEAMQSVHEMMVVHRDIKPGNIMIRSNGQVCILDFGVAKSNDQSSGASHTVMGSVIGTDGYMSPEQANGLSIDHRSDIYSLACVFYYMLTGHHAYVCDGNQVKMLMDIANKPFPRLKEHVSGLPAEIQTIMDKASDKNMMKRYQSCREFSIDLKSFINPGTHIDAPTATSEIRVSIGREKCDIVAGVDNYKVSRHHADVTFRVLTGGSYYVYTDCSSNGTTIDGTQLHKGMSFNIPAGTNPKIWLANDPTANVDWQTVVELIATRMPHGKPAGDDISESTSGNTRIKSGSRSILSRLKRLFKR